MDISLILVVVAGLVLLGLVIFMILAYRRGGEGKEPNYRALFVLGITWLPIGIATRNPGFWGVGAVFFIVGLANRGLSLIHI